MCILYKRTHLIHVHVLYVPELHRTFTQWIWNGSDDLQGCCYNQCVMHVCLVAAKHLSGKVVIACCAFHHTGGFFAYTNSHSGSTTKSP